MNAYELADELQKHGLNGDNYGLFNKRIQNMLRQQADRIAELEQNLSAYIVELELHKAMIQELEKQLAFMEGEYPEPTIVQKMQEFANLEQALRKIAKYEEVLHAIANDYHELSEHKIEVQVRNHKKWAREALNEL